MSSDSDKSLTVWLAMLTIAAPLLAPEFFIIVGSIAWAIFYTLIWLMDWGADFSHGIPHLTHWGFDSTESLPAVYGSQDISDRVWLTLIVAAVGLLRGPIGSLAMICVWAPLFFIGPFEVAIGTGVEQDKASYIESNYTQETCKAVDISSTQVAKYCLFVPKSGKKLPYFIQDVYNNGSSPEKVIPYYEFGKSNYNLNSIDINKSNDKTQNDNGLTVTKFLTNWLTTHYIQASLIAICVIIALLM